MFSRPTLHHVEVIEKPRCLGPGDYAIAPIMDNLSTRVNASSKVKDIKAPQTQTAD